MGTKTLKKKNKKLKKTVKKTLKKTVKTLKDKNCFTNDEISTICNTGKYTTQSKLYTHVPMNVNTNKTNNTNKINKTELEYKDYKAQLIKTFRKHNNPMVENKHAKKDFYNYVNDVWLKQTDIEAKPEYYVEVDNFRVVQDKVYNQLIEYINDYIKQNPTAKKAIAIKNVRDSIKNNTIPSLKKHVTEIVKEVEAFIAKDDMYALLADINKNEIISWGSPIVWSLLPDEKNVKKYVSHLSSPELSIYDYMIYIEDPSDNKETKQYKKFVKTQFLKYIDEMFTACLGTKNHGYNPQDIWDIESDILDSMGCNSIKKDDPNYYNVVSDYDLEHTFDFDWKHFSALLGYKTPPKKIIVSSLNALKCAVPLIKKNWKTDKWHMYWLYVHFRQLIRFENSYRHIHYDFFKHLLEGQPKIMPDEIYPIFALSMTFNTFLTEQYVKHNYNPLYVNYVQHLVDDLKYIFKRKIGRNTWLSPSTKKSALLKLDKLEIIIGTPDNLREDPLLNYVSDDPWYNMRLLTGWKHDKYIQLEGQAVIDIPEIDWKNFKLVGTQAYMVNAYYRPTSNSIYVPLAYLQKPFIDLEERGIEYNLVFIGYTLGHELSHSLDDMGSKFDENGNLNNWWSDADRKKFKAKIKDVVNQYEEFAKRDGINFDAEVGVGEDLADISGMSLVEEYLNDFNKKNNIINMMKKTSLETFYTYIAIQAQQKIYKQAVKAQLKMNPHPLERYRTNCPLTRLELFREIYNIKKGDNMWWHNTDTIW